jgi:lysozyme
MDIREEATNSIRSHEGLSLNPYKDSEGFLTIGYGHCLDRKQITIDVAELILKHDVDDAILRACKYPWFDKLSNVRKVAIIDMCFNLGSVDAFPRFQTALEKGDWQEAHDEMLDSLWAKQVGYRSNNLALMILRG